MKLMIVKNKSNYSLEKLDVYEKIIREIWMQ